MALLGHLITISAQMHSSGTVNEIIAESTSVNLDITAETPETTSQVSALNATFIGGKVTGTVSGDYLLASAGTQFSQLFVHMNAGNTISVDIENDGTPFISCDGVITSLGLGGGLSDSLATGSYSIQLSGDPAT